MRPSPMVRPPQPTHETLPTHKQPSTGKRFYVTRIEHPNEVVYAENVLEYLALTGVPATEIVMNPDGAHRSELEQCLQPDTLGVLGTNWHLDHSCCGNQIFLQAAAAAGVPIIQWILDHPSSRWPHFTATNADNSRFLFLSAFSEAYFRRFIIPECRSGWTVGTGPSRHSRVNQLTRRDFLARDILCILPLNVKRLGGTLAHVESRLAMLPGNLQRAVNDGIAAAQNDLQHPIERHFFDGSPPPNLLDTAGEMHQCIQIIEEIVQIRRRLGVFKIASEFPVLLQSDIASEYLDNFSAAAYESGVSMTETLVRMRCARAVVSLTHINDEIHNRTLNGLNAGAVNIIEDTPAHREFFTHGDNALLFRYGDDSLRECLELVCSDPSRAYDIALAGAALKDDPQLRFGGFDNLLRLSEPALSDQPHPVEVHSF